MTSTVMKITSPRSAMSGVSIATAISSTAQQWYGRIQQRHQMTEMSAHQMRDMGVSAADVYAETSKPFWR